jgi:hypothetical protein
MKTTFEDSIQTLNINGTLIKAILNGSIVVNYNFTGWTWYVLVKHPKGKFKVIEDEQFGKREFQYTQYCTNENVFYEAVHRNGTPKEVLKNFKKDFYESKYLNERAFEVGNIK